MMSDLSGGLGQVLILIFLFSDLPNVAAGEPALFASECLLQIGYYTYGIDDALALVAFSEPEAHTISAHAR